MPDTDTDLKFSSDTDDLVVETIGGESDFALVYDLDVLIQDIYNQVRIHYYTWSMDFTYGSFLLTNVNVPDEPIRFVELKNDVIAILRRDRRIVKESWYVRISSLGIEVQFLPVGREEPITLSLEPQQ